MYNYHVKYLNSFIICCFIYETMYDLRNCVRCYRPSITDPFTLLFLGMLVGISKKYV